MELLGVQPPTRNARDRLINNAIELCYRRGFNAVGLDQIIDAAGVTKTTFYKHFTSKDDLLIAAIRMRDDWEGKAWVRAVQHVAGDNPKAQLLGVFDVLDEWFNSPDFGGCMFINAAAEFPDPNDPVHQAAAEHKKASHAWFHSLAVGAGFNDADAFADQYLAVVEGTLIMRHVHGRDDAARVARPLIEHLIDQHAAVTAPTRRGR